MASKKTFSATDEQRRQTRLAVSQSARMVLDSGREILCDIVDFCLGGLFLKFALLEDGELIRGQEGSLLRIAFTTPAELGGQNYEFPVRLVRQNESGIGVAFEDTPVAAVLALNKVAAAMRSQKTEIKLYGGADINVLKQSCKAYFRQAIENAFAKFGELIIPRMEAAAMAAKSNTEQNELMDAQWQIHPAITEARSRCLNMLLGRLDTPGLGGETEEGVSGDLSIVEKDDFEEWLSLATASNKLEEQFSEVLGILELRLEKTYGVALDAKNNPFGPAVITKGIQHAFAEMSLPLAARQVVYATMREAMGEPLETLYQALLGVLPAVEDEKKLAAPIVKSLTSALPVDMMAASLGTVASSLVGYVHHSQAGPGWTGRAPDASALPVPWLQALQELVTSGKIPAVRQAEARVSADVFGELVGAVNAETTSAPPELKQQFKRLEDSLFKLAVADPTYFNNPGHAAHGVLNAMDKLSQVSSDDGRIEDERLLKHINHWVGRIQNEADTHPGVFDEVRGQIDKVLRPLMKERGVRIAKLQAALEGWQKTGQANRMVLQELEQRVAGRNVPAVVLDLFASGWRNYLIRVILRKGSGSPEEAEAWQVMDNLLAWLDQGQPGKPAYQDIQHLLQTVDSHLRLVSADKDTHDRLVDQLADALLKPGNIACRAITSILPAQATEADAGEDKSADDLLDSFRVGDWFSFAGLPAPLNLIWVGDDPAFYVFCNYRGIKKLELKREEFVERLNAGGAKLVEDLELPLMDRSFSSMIQNLHKDLLKQAVVDEQTGLISRSEFMRQARARLLHMGDRVGRSVAPNLAMGVLDIESLRLIRSRIDPAGYGELVRALARHLEQMTADSGLLTQSADYSFAFLLPASSREQAQAAGEKFISELNQFSFKWEDTVHTLSANLGLVYSVIFLDPEELYHRADEACVEAKHLGRNQVAVYQDEAAENNGHSRLDYWSSRLTETLQDGQLFLRCQPIVPIGNGASMISHYEILLGANPDSEQPVNIGEMVAAVEQLRRVSEIDRWVIGSIFKWMRENPEKVERLQGFSINLSGQSVNNRTFLEFLTAELGQGDVPGEKLIFEITESAAIDSFAHAQRFIRQVRRYGCRFALDDFGVGFSSFNYLKNLKVDYLKIDGSFIRNMSRNEVDVALVSSLHETSRFLGIKTIAEVVEDQETLDILRRIGVDYAQGYFTGKPVLIEQLTV